MDRRGKVVVCSLPGLAMNTGFRLFGYKHAAGSAGGSIASCILGSGESADSYGGWEQKREGVCFCGGGGGTTAAGVAVAGGGRAEERGAVDAPGAGGSHPAHAAARNLCRDDHQWVLAEQGADREAE